MKKINFLIYTTGNILIIASLALLVFTYYPILALYFSFSQPKINKNNPYIEINKIKVISPIILNVDPSNPNEYKSALKNGVALAKGSSFPGKKGLVYLFAHSSDYPWNMTRYNTPFFTLNQLNKDDRIIISLENKKYIYKVTDKKIVWPNETQYLKNDSSSNQILILQTCYPIGTDIQRLLVFAKQM